MATTHDSIKLTVLNGPNEDEQLLLLSADSDRQQQENEHILLSTREAETRGETTPANKEKEDRRESVLNDGVAVKPLLPVRCSSVPARYVIAVWTFFGFVCMYTLRVNLSVAIVAMVAPQNELNKSVTSCPVSNTSSPESLIHYEFDWQPSMQGIVLGAFFYGYVIAQVIGGNLAEKFGSKWIFGGCILIAAILTLLTPLAARTHVGLLVAVRVLIGLFQGPGYPSAAALWGKWIPPAERSTVPAAAQSGTNLGVIFATPLVSIMSDSTFLGGWPSAFYVFGAISCLWFVGWCYFGFSSPDDHPRITNKERIYLTKHSIINTRKHLKTPWKSIACSPPVYAIAIIYICSNYVYYTLLTSLPIYFATVLNFKLYENGFLFALPYLGHLVFTIISAQIADHIQAHKFVTITTLRRAQTIIGTSGTCVFLLGVGYVGCNHVSAVLCCTFAVAFIGMQNSGSLISHLDVAPNYAGTIVGIANSLGSIPGFIGPYVVGAITNNNQTLQAWRLIFNISAGIGAFGCIAYCILFNGEEQPWNQAHFQHGDRTSSS